MKKIRVYKKYEDPSVTYAMTSYKRNGKLIGVFDTTKEADIAIRRDIAKDAKKN